MDVKKTLIVLSGMLTALLLTAPASADKFYKWTDENGQTHYSSKPPADNQATVVRTQTQDTSGAVEALQADQERVDELAQQRADSKADKAAEEARKKEVKAQCDKARQNLDGLLNSQRIFTEGEDGSRQRLSEEQRQDNINKSRQFIRENCK